MEMEIVYIKLQPWNTPKAAIDFKGCGFQDQTTRQCDSTTQLGTIVMVYVSRT